MRSHHKVKCMCTMQAAISSDKNCQYGKSTDASLNLCMDRPELSRYANYYQ